MTPTITLSSLGIRQDGTFFLSGGEIATPAGYSKSFGLAGILPFRLDSLRIDFPNPTDLNTFTLGARGHVLIDDLATLLPFTPVVSLNGGAATIRPGINTPFDITFDVQSLSTGRIVPRNVGPITLGMEGWDLGGVGLNALLELGSYDASGALQPLPGINAQARATFTVTSSNNPDLAVNAVTVALGTFRNGPNGATVLDLAGSFNVDANGQAAAGQVKFDFTAHVSATPPQTGDGWVVSVTGELTRVTITNAVIRLGDVLEITVTQATLGDDPATAPVEIFVASGATVKLLAYPNETTFTLSLAELTVTTASILVEDLALTFADNTSIAPGVFALTQFVVLVDGSFNYTRNGDQYTVTNLAGGVQLSADRIEVFPNAPGDALFSADDITGQFESRGEIALTAATAEANVASVLALSLTNVQFYLGTDPNRDRVSVGTVSATFAGLADVSVTLAGFRVSNAGFFSVQSATASAASGVFQSLGLGGIMPIDITRLTFRFTEAGAATNLANFVLEVEGTLNEDALSGLPFTPLFSIGGVAQGFIFSVTYANGRFAPLNVAQITFGFADLSVGPAVLGATLTLGGYVNGVFQSTFGGSVSIEGLEGAAISFQISGDVTPDNTVTSANEGALDLLATATASFSFAEGAIAVTGADLTFDLRLTAAPGPGLAIEHLEFNGASIDEVEVQFGELLTLFADDVTIDFNPAVGEPMITFGGTPASGGTGVRLGNDATGSIFDGWGGAAGQFAIGRNGELFVLPEFFVIVTVPPAEKLGLPDFLPIEITELGILFEEGAFGPGTGEYANATVIRDPLAFTLLVSGGIVPNDNLPFPIAASLDGLQVDIARLANGQFPIVGLDGFSVEVGPVTLGGEGGLEIYGALSLGQVTVDLDPDQASTRALLSTFEWQANSFTAGSELGSTWSSANPARWLPRSKRVTRCPWDRPACFSPAWRAASPSAASRFRMWPAPISCWATRRCSRPWKSPWP